MIITEDDIPSGCWIPKSRPSRVVHCSTCDNSQELNDQITDQIAISDGWLLEPVVFCPRCGPDDDDKGE